MNRKNNTRKQKKKKKKNTENLYEKKTHQVVHDMNNMGSEQS